MKRAVFVGAILGCLAMFACAAALCGFLLVTGWLAPAHASFQQELFFDYTKTEAVASAQFCPTLESKVRALTAAILEQCQIAAPLVFLV